MEEIRSQSCADGAGYSSFWQLEYDFCRKLVCSIVLSIMPVFLACNLFFLCSLLSVFPSFYSPETPSFASARGIGVADTSQCSV